MLDLTFLATGRRQHVFILTTDPDGPWVYKIPAAFGFLLPYQHEVRLTGRVTSWKRALHWALIALPARLHASLLHTTAARIESHVPGGTLALAIPRGIARIVRGTRNQVLVRHFRRARARDFMAMLDRLDELSAAGLVDLVLPFQTNRQAEALLRIDGVVTEFHGPLLQQRRVDAVFNSQRLLPFDAQVLVDAQHRLWRHGFALAEKGEVLGYRSWTLHAGRLCLADTSSLTRSLAHALRALDDRELDRQAALVTARQTTPEAADAFGHFFSQVRAAITPAKLTELWRAEAGSASRRAIRVSRPGSVASDGI